MTDALARTTRSNAYDERRMTTHRNNPPAAPPAVTTEQLPDGALYRVVTNYAALKDAFSERIEDLDVTLSEIDQVTGMTRGCCQKLLSKSNARWTREFGWKTLGDMLRGTGLVIALVVDDERFAPIKSQLVRRRTRRGRHHD